MNGMNDKVMTSDMEMEAEPGATDNQLTLSLGDYVFTKEWEDGGTYRLTVEVTQTAPGVFRVDSAVPEEVAEEEQGPVETEEAGYSEATNSNSYPNPAVAKMMSNER
jgi:hypothetical protein